MPKVDEKLREAGYYAQSGEQVNYTTVDAGGKYYVVTLNGVASIILDSNLEPVTSQEVVSRVAAGYVKALGVPFKQSDVDLLKSNFNAFNASFELCRYDQSPGAYYNFTRGIGMFCMMDSQVISNPSLRRCEMIYDFDLIGMTVVGNTYSSVRQYKHDMRNGTMMINASLPKLKQSVAAVEAAVAAGDVGVVEKLAQGAKDAADVQAGVTRFNAGHDVMKGIPPWGSESGGKLNRCVLSSTALAAVASTLDSYKSFPTVASITGRVAAETAARKDGAAKRKAVGESGVLLDSFRKKALQLDESFAAASGSVTTFASKGVKELEGLLAGVNNATTASQAAAAASAFKAKHTSLAKLVDDVGALVPSLKASKASLQNSSSALAQVMKVFGASDGRVAALQAEQSGLQKAFDLKQGDLSAGRLATKSELEELKANATTLAFTALTLPRTENQVDLVLVAGLAVLVIIVAAGFFFLRKFKGAISASGKQKEVAIEKIPEKKGR